MQSWQRRMRFTVNSGRFFRDSIHCCIAFMNAVELLALLRYNVEMDVRIGLVRVLHDAFQVVAILLLSHSIASSL